MRNFTIAILTSVLACTPSAAPPPAEPSPAEPSAVEPTPVEPAPVEPAPIVVEPGPPPGDPEWPCATDAACVLATRASLGCCDPCPIVEAMSVAQRDEIANLCGLHNGGERCPPMEPFDCPPEESIPSGPVCRDGVCRRGP
jgi:hypothetical protein